MHRPAPLQLNENSDNGDLRPPRFPNFHMDVPSPRAGDTPPALSPLDAFAMHSRLLARRFEQEAEAGRRISRLPHNDVAKEMANRPNYFRNQRGSGDDGSMSDIAESSDGSRPNTRGGQTVRHKKSIHRPKSFYPAHERISRLETDIERAGVSLQDPQEQLQNQPPEPASDYFVFPRASSPELMDPRVNVEAPSPNVPSLTNSVESFSSSSQPSRNLSDKSSRTQMSDRNLQPLRSPLMPKSPRSLQSIRQVRQDSGDEDSSQSYSATTSARKYSGSSGMSIPLSPFTPSTIHHAHRSPSVASEYSLNGFSHSPRPPTMNFSRPDRPMTPELHLRQSSDSRGSFEARDTLGRPNPVVTSDLQASPPRSIDQDVPRPFAASDGNATSDSENGDATRTYTYAKYSLPRGRGVDRTSMGFRSSWIEKQFNWDDDSLTAPAVQPVVNHDRSVSAVMPTPVMPITMRPASSLGTERYRPPAVTNLPVRPGPTSPQQSAFSRNHSTSSALASHKPMDSIDSYGLDSPTLPPMMRPSSAIPDLVPPVMLPPARPTSASSLRPFNAPRPSSPAHTQSSFEVTRGRHVFNNAARSHSADTRLRAKANHASTASVATDSTDRTIRASPLLSSEVSPEDHLEIGIQAHSAGQTNKSTYHFRLAARAGLPTAMLLYALACRHGWGMRANQEEGVKWLQKAIDTSQLDEQYVDQTLIAVTRRSGILDPAAEAAERKKRKAQFSLAIYELGMSYIKGWGCPKDPKLGLRCYEIAGDWGDCDALAEAGFCYTQGLGCKKDMFKAAALYRKAASLGMSMTGNSWIYKDKYMQSTEPGQGKKSMDATSLAPIEKEGRARSKSIWSRVKKDKS